MQKNRYQENIKKAMEWLGKKEILFLGQTVEYPGSPMYKSLLAVPDSKKLEMPVFENTQMGISIGFSIDSKTIPVSIFPRIDFLICAVDQLVNHLDKVEEMSYGEFKPGVIIRTQIGNNKPLYPGPQHCQDHTTALRKMCKNIKVIKIIKASEVMKVYKDAYKRARKGKSTLIIEKPTGAFGGKR